MQIKTVPEDFIVKEIASHDVKESGPYLLLELTKRNTTTERALSAIADAFRLQRKQIGFAGTKDARALTKQYITIRADASLAERIKKIHVQNAALRFLGFVQEPLTLGLLEKNSFEIVVRKIDHEKIHPISMIPNFYDEQRFSSANADIGRHIIKSEFKEAVELILRTGTDVDDRIRQHLDSKQNDYITALRMIPKSILLLYVHAYQSLLFNEVLAAYIRLHDPNAIEVPGPVPFCVPTKEIPAAAIPIFGFGTDPDPVFGPLYEKILAREGLEPRDFVVRSLPFLTVEGGVRDAFFAVEDLVIGEREDDNLHPGYMRQRLAFTLSKGCYATMVIKCLYRVGFISGDAMRT
jgi:tRNA pseudouridine13 synthase